MRPLRNPSEVLVIGGGLAGLSAARHAARLGRHVSLLEAAGLFGGQVATVAEVDGLAAPGTFSGQDLANHLLAECRKLNVSVVEAEVARFEAGETVLVHDGNGHRYAPAAVVIAAGARLRPLGVPGEEEFAGRGVSHCAACDGPFFRGQDVAVIGGGDSAAQEALLLARTCRTVILLCRSAMRAKRQYVEQLASQENVRFVWRHTVEAIIGDSVVTGLRLRGPAGDASEVTCAGVFPYVGVAPNTGFLPPSFRNVDGHVRTDDALRTGHGRVFAAGAVRAGYGGDVAQAMAEGVSAAIAADRCIRSTVPQHGLGGAGR